MWLANLLVNSQKEEVEKQKNTVKTLRKVSYLQQVKAKKNLSQLVARPDTLAILFASGWLKGRYSNSSDSKKMATGSFLMRLFSLIT